MYMKVNPNVTKQALFTRPFNHLYLTDIYYSTAAENNVLPYKGKQACRTSIHSFFYI